MSKNITPVFTTGISMTGTTFANADGAGDVTGTNSKSVCAAAANDSRIYKVCITSNDTSARDMLFYLYNGTTKFLIGAISVPAGSGMSSAAISVSFLAGLTLYVRQDQNGNYFINLPTGWSLYAAAGAAVTAGKLITVVCSTEDF